MFPSLFSSPFFSEIRKNIRQLQQKHNLDSERQSVCRVHTPAHDTTLICGNCTGLQPRVQSLVFPGITYISVIEETQGGKAKSDEDQEEPQGLVLSSFPKRRTGTTRDM